MYAINAQKKGGLFIIGLFPCVLHFLGIVCDLGEIYAWGCGTSNQLGQSEDQTEEKADQNGDFWKPVIMTGKQLSTRYLKALSLFN